MTVNPHRDLSAEAKTQVVGIDEFEVFGMIGEGTYGKVYLGQKKKGGKFYAVKAISKQKITINKKQHEIFRERQALIMLDHPNIVKMYWSFVVRYIFCKEKKSIFRTREICTSCWIWHRTVNFSNI